jgi:hypothetical protein
MPVVRFKVGAWASLVLGLVLVIGGLFTLGYADQAATICVPRSGNWCPAGPGPAVPDAAARQDQVVQGLIAAGIGLLLLLVAAGLLMLFRRLDTFERRYAVLTAEWNTVEAA